MSLDHLNTSNILELDQRKRANLINSLAGVKPCNLIGTISSKGEENLAIISSVFHLGASPALLGFVIRPDSVPRDTLSNIREMKSCTLNNVVSSNFKKAHQTSARYPKDVCEFTEVGLSPLYQNGLTAPFVKESTVMAHLEFVKEISLEENATHIVICKITDIFHKPGALFEDGTINLKATGSIGVGGLNTYYDISEIARLAYAKPGKQPQNI